MSGAGSTIAKVAAGALALGAGCFAYGSLYEVDAYTLRRISVPVLPPGAQPIRILHVSDLHLTPKNRVRQEWVSSLAGLDPDLVINTGDNLAHPDAVPSVIDALGRLLGRPGVYVWGSNDYYAPTFKNPLAYLTQPSRQGQAQPDELPWRDLGRAFLDAGWIDLSGERATVEINGIRLGFRGTDDAHLRRDQYVLVAGSVDRTETDVAIGVTHAPYRRILDPMAADGMDLIVAGHTHGGQVCVPFYGALVTNCDLNTRRVKGLSQHSAGGKTSYLHVSAGVGTSPYAPFRFACRPEATLMSLVPARS